MVAKLHVYLFLKLKDGHSMLLHNKGNIFAT